MIKYSAKTKLTTLSILGTLAYCLLIIYSFADNWDDFKLGFKEGYSLKVQTYFVDIKAKESFSTFPDSIINIKTDENINIRYDKAQVRAAIIPSSCKYMYLYQTIEMLLSFVVFYIATYIPILFFKLMRTLIDEVVFDKKNIRYLNKIGLFLIVFYVVNCIFNYVSYLKNIAMFDFADYTIQREPTDLIWLLLGIVVLLFAEILSKGSIIQEEQDLTI